VWTTGSRNNYPKNYLVFRKSTLFCSEKFVILKISF